MLLFGARYTAGAGALAILAMGQLINTGAGPVGQVINLSGRPYLSMLNHAAVAAINIGACLILIPRFGMIGAACSTASALTLVNLIKVVEVRVIFGMYPFRLDSVRATAACALAALVTAPVVIVPAWPSALAEVLVSSAILLGSYTVFVWSLGVSAEDRKLLEAVKTRIGHALVPGVAGR
jgi:O-antigen/teichoic acid export membrane protein